MSRGQIRVVLFAAIASITLLVLGVGELWRCMRTVFGPTEVPYSQLGAEGLAGHGFVRVTGVRPVHERTAIIIQTKKAQSASKGRWVGAYVPVLDGAAPDDSGLCSLLAYAPHVRSEADCEAVEDLFGDSGDQLIGFVEGPYESLDFKHQQLIAPAARVNNRNCWVVDIRPPSWFKGLGLVLVGLAIPGIAAAWKLKRGFVS